MGHRGYVQPCQEVIDFSFQIFCDNKIQQILQERQIFLVVVDLLLSSCICTSNKLIKSKAISPLPDTKT